MSLWQAIHGWVLLRPCFIPPKVYIEKSLKIFNGTLWDRVLSVEMHHELENLTERQALLKNQIIYSIGESLELSRHLFVDHEQPKYEYGKFLYEIYYKT